MYPLELKVSKEAWRLYTLRNRNKGFEKFRTQVMERDDHTCQFCGFQAQIYQEIVNLDHDYHNNKLANLATSCCFCTQCLFLESVGVGEFGGGTLIYLPEIAQADINSFCHVLFCAITNDTGYKQSSENIYRSLRFRSQIIENKFGEGSANPRNFSQMLIELSAEDDEKVQSMLKDVRLLPSRAKFREQIEKWAAMALEELTTEA